MSISPTAEGFRVAFRRPTFTLAEIAWRWTAGATATTLFFYGLYQYLDTLPVNSGELMFLRSGQPYLVVQAIAHIFRGSLGRALLAGFVGALMIGLLWMVAASVGRIATVRALLEHFRRDVASSVSAGSPETSGARDATGDIASNVPTTSESTAALFPSLFRLNFLRAAVAGAAVVGLLGTMIVAGFVSPAEHPRPGLAFLLFLPLAALVACVAWWLNWILSVALIFAVRDAHDAVGAISAAVSFLRVRGGAVSAVTSWTGLAHLVAYIAAAIAASIPLGLIGAIPWRLGVLGALLVTLIYFVVADWLQVARLAGYVRIAETPEAPVPLPQPAPIAPPSETVASPLSPTGPLEATPLQTVSIAMN